MNFEQTRRYWEERASGDPTAQSTTQDVYLREIEARVLSGILARHRPQRVLDAGCGDARTTVRLAGEFPDTQFIAGDYSTAMLRNAEANVRTAKLQNVRLCELDVTRPLQQTALDLVYTTRCLINLPDWEAQQQAIDYLRGALKAGGLYVMIENFIEGHDNFNRVRQAFGLAAIAVREHNLFFERARTEAHLRGKFEIAEETNISSAYYLVSRVVYSKLCDDQGVKPDYFDAHHRYAAALPFSGEYGPVRMLCLRKL